ncbi:hypothetical protein KFE25_005933 [Diacronema lutheri]|uniref:histone acetyltransferase n=1 Tax=Diacronema lutheri TaxID=2081491 RepID=A0A8J6CJ28_DIALT|nr:hypothetical protein KFE25_005933 [Diacronema lutheri]
MAVGLSLRSLIREIESRVDDETRVALETLTADIFANRVAKADVQPRLCALVGHRVFKHAAMAIAGHASPPNAPGLADRQPADWAATNGSATAPSDGAKEPRLADLRAVLLHASTCAVHECAVLRCAWARHKLVALEREGAADAADPVALAWRQLEAQRASAHGIGFKPEPPLAPPSAALPAEPALLPAAPLGCADARAPTAAALARQAKRVRLCAPVHTAELGGTPALVGSNYVCPSVAAWARVGARVQVRSAVRFGRPRQMRATVLDVDMASGEVLLRYDVLRLPCAQQPTDGSLQPPDRAPQQRAARARSLGDAHGDDIRPRAGEVDVCLEDEWLPLIPSRLRPLPGAEADEAHERGAEAADAAAAAAATAAALATALMPPPPAPLSGGAGGALTAAWEAEAEAGRPGGARSAAVLTHVVGALVDVRSPARAEHQRSAPGRVVRALPGCARSATAGGGRGADAHRLWYEVELKSAECADALARWAHAADAPRDGAPPARAAPGAAGVRVITPWRALRARCAACRRHALSVERSQRACSLCSVLLQPPAHAAFYELPEVAQMLGGSCATAAQQPAAHGAHCSVAEPPSELKMCVPCYEKLARSLETGEASAAPYAQPMPPPRTVNVGGMSVSLDDLWLCRTDGRADNALVRCASCGTWVHAVCALALPAVDAADGHRLCGECMCERCLAGVAAGAPPAAATGCAPPSPPPSAAARVLASAAAAASDGAGCGRGPSLPPPSPLPRTADGLRVRQLPTCAISREIEAALAAELRSLALEPDGALLVRLLANTDASNAAKRQMRVRRWSSGEAYPRAFPHTLHALLCAQQRDGADVALFMMYAQEYGAACEQPNTNRVYISYVDSLRYLALRPGSRAPDGARTAVYHALMLAYVANCRARGFGHVHIWVQPPRLGDEYLFLGRPAEHLRAPNRAWLRGWYESLLRKGVAKGLVSRFGGMLDEFGAITSARQIPMFQGDHWDAFVPQMVGCCAGARAPAQPPPGARDAPTGGGAQLSGGAPLRTAGASDGPPPREQQLELRRAALACASASAGAGAGVGGTPMTKANSSALVAHAQRHMMKLQGHFLIATLAPLPAQADAAPREPEHDAQGWLRPPAAPAAAPAELCASTGTLAGLSPPSPLCRSRMHFVTHCRSHGLQFNSRRYAEYSTAMIVHALLRPHGARDQRHCLDSCLRNNVDDGSASVECGRCRTWVHTCCIKMSDLAYRTMEAYRCPTCTLRDLDEQTGALARAASGGCDAFASVDSCRLNGAPSREADKELASVLGVKLVRELSELSDDWPFDNIDIEALGLEVDEAVF